MKIDKLQLDQISKKRAFLSKINFCLIYALRLGYNRRDISLISIVILLSRFFHCFSAMFDIELSY